MPRVFISAAEMSADMHGAALIEAARTIIPGIEFCGVAGPAMEAAGCRNLFNFTRHSAMLTGAFRHIAKGMRLLKDVERRFRDEHWDAVVVIDSPVLHLPIAGKAKRAGLPVLYYAAPQLWAWGAWRMGKLRRNTDRLAVILPFEERYFREHGIAAEFVGHPLFDTLQKQIIDPSKVDGIRRQGRPVIAVLPGSRSHVVKEVLPGQLEVCEGIRRKYPDAVCRASVAREDLSDEITKVVGADRPWVRVHDGQLGDLLVAADLTLVASGTATLEVAHYGSPMIVMYNGSRFLYHVLGRWLIKTKFLSLLNILADREIVPEFMPYYRSTTPIAEKAVELLGSPEKVQQMKSDMSETLQPLKKTSATQRTAHILKSLVNSKPHRDVTVKMSTE